jgi:hypothetical protein
VRLGNCWGDSIAQALAKLGYLASCIGISIVLVALALRRKRREPGFFHGRINGNGSLVRGSRNFRRCLVAESVRCVAVLMPAVGFIVGLHFLGLWKATDLHIDVLTLFGQLFVGQQSRADSGST